MQISPDQGQFMAMLAGILEARRILEIGVFTGYSSLCFALNLPEDGQLVALDESEEWDQGSTPVLERSGCGEQN